MMYRPTIKSGDVVVVITKRRMDNLRIAFPFITWLSRSLRITYLGYGDKPTFAITGVYYDRGAKKRAVVTWESASPGGGYPKMYIGSKVLPVITSRVIGFSKAYFHRADEIEKWLKNY